MKKNLSLFVLTVFAATSCKQNANEQLSTIEGWKLGWRMIESSIEENYEFANAQFDSLLNHSNSMDNKMLATGLEIKHQLGKHSEVAEILSNQNEKVLSEICKKQFLANQALCKGLSDEKVANEDLRMELIKMYVDDQAARGNLMEDIIAKYGIDSTKITENGAVGVDEKNRNRLQDIINEYGFPTRRLVGKDAMQGIFLIIQHADGDRGWQQSQLKNIEKAVEAGEMDGQSYAYLYDRIKINSGEKQLYGTQFAKVDPVNKTVELAETEDMENLDERRRAVGMMPIEMYKRFMLKNL